MKCNPSKSAFLKVVLAAFVFLFALNSCSAKPKATQVLKFAVLPILDSLPMYGAQQEGLFKKYNLEKDLKVKKYRSIILSEKKWDLII